MMSLDDALEQVSVFGPGLWENADGPEGWWAVCDEDGIIAYFGSEVNAFHFRLAVINAKLNPIVALVETPIE